MSVYAHSAVQMLTDSSVSTFLAQSCNHQVFLFPIGTTTAKKKSQLQQEQNSHSKRLKQENLMKGILTEVWETTSCCQRRRASKPATGRTTELMQEVSGGNKYSKLSSSWLTVYCWCIPLIQATSNQRLRMMKCKPPRECRRVTWTIAVRQVENNQQSLLKIFSRRGAKPMLMVCLVRALITKTLVQSATFENKILRLTTTP